MKIAVSMSSKQDTKANPKKKNDPTEFSIFWLILVSSSIGSYLVKHVPPVAGAILSVYLLLSWAFLSVSIVVGIYQARKEIVSSRKNSKPKQILKILNELAEQEFKPLVNAEPDESNESIKWEHKVTYKNITFMLNKNVSGDSPHNFVAAVTTAWFNNYRVEANCATGEYKLVKGFNPLSVDTIAVMASLDNVSLKKEDMPLIQSLCGAAFIFDKKITINIPEWERIKTSLTSGKLTVNQVHFFYFHPDAFHEAMNDESYKDVPRVFLRKMLDLPEEFPIKEEKREN